MSSPAPGPHPLTNAFWFDLRGAGDPDDQLRCDDCRGYLSFEFHDAWHDMHEWNEHVRVQARAKERGDFDKSQVRTLRPHAPGKWAAAEEARIFD